MDQNVIDLPKHIPMVAIANDVLFPNVHMTLFLAGEFHLSLIRDALKTNRYIGIVQQRPEDENRFFSIGTLAKIEGIIDMDGDALKVQVEGSIRFNIMQFIKKDTPYYTAEVSYESYLTDVQDLKNQDPAILLLTLHKMLETLDLLEFDWNVVNHCSSSTLLKHLTQICPLSSTQKQHLLETQTLEEQTVFLSQYMEEFLYNQTAQ